MQLEVKKVPCEHCPIPVAELRPDGALVIRVKHYGALHETKITLVAIDKGRLVVVG